MSDDKMCPCRACDDWVLCDLAFSKGVIPCDDESRLEELKSTLKQKHKNYE